MEEILARHRKEQKELQGKITSKKKNASKKTRKGVNDECDRLEYDLQQTQQAEIDAFNQGHTASEISYAPTDPSEAVINRTANLQINMSNADQASNIIHHADDTASTPNTSQPQPQRKPNRQKARMARKVAEQEAAIAAAEAEAASMPDQRDIELSSMKAQLTKRGLVETFIRPDGHCLYSACALSLRSAGGGGGTSGPTKMDYQTVRKDTADFIAAHPDDFAPFIEEPLDTYTGKIRGSAEWGGHLELSAIARTYGVNIHVLRSSGQVDIMRPDAGSGDHATEKVKDVWLAYYQHSFGLGEHYNALTPGKIEGKDP